MSAGRRLRRAADRAFTLAAIACALVACTVVAGLVGVIVTRALPALDWRFLVSETAAAGAAGGVRQQLLGTGILVATSLLLATPLAVALALAQGVYASPRSARRLGVLLLAASGVPSILFGLFGFLFFSRFLGWGKSWLAGGAVLAMMIVPTAAVALAERIAALPKSYVEAAAGLGLSRSAIVWRVILPQCRSGLVSGLGLGLARAAGETAPILFCAAVFSGASLPRGIVESPVLALPYHIFTLAQDSYGPAAEGRMWAAASVLLALVLALSLAALPARLAHAREVRDA